MRVIAVLCLAVALSSCGIDAQQGAHVFESSEVPFGLTNAIPSSTVGTAALGPNVATTATPVSFDVYFIKSGILVAVARRAPADPTPGELIARLIAGPSPAEVAAGHRSALAAPDVVTHTSESSSLVTVDLARTFSEVPRSDRILALGQITLTLTARPGTTLVQYTIADVPIEVPKANGVVTRDPVSQADYSALLQAPSSSTSAPSTIPATTAASATTG